MLQFLVRRLLSGLGVLLVSSFLMYMMVDFALDPLEELRTSTDPDVETLIAERIALLNLEASPIERYIDWFGGAITGDFGFDWESGRPVNEALPSAIAATVQLVTFATFLAIPLGVGVGIISALRQYTSLDYIVIFISFVLYSLPVFWVAVLLKQWGAVGFNDFLADASLSPLVIAVIAAVFGGFVMLAVAGDLKRRLVSFVVAAAAVVAVLFYLQLTDWWTEPHIGPELLVLNGLGAALGITLLSTGLSNRRALFSAFTVVVLTLAMYFPLQPALNALTESEVMSWWIVIAFVLVFGALGFVIGRLWGGPDWRQSARVGMLVALVMGVLVILDRIMQAWPSYMDDSRINGRPVRTMLAATPGFDGDFWETQLNTFGHLILPTLALLLLSFASYTRFARGSMLEVLGQDYMRTARAKGLGERTVVMRHGFRNTMIPLATLVPVDIITLFGGALITEQIFARPGMGTLFLSAFDRNVIDPMMAYLVITAGLAIVANIVADLIYATIDPRIRVNA